MEIEQCAFPSYLKAKQAMLAAEEEIVACSDMQELNEWREEKDSIFGKLRDFDIATNNNDPTTSYADYLNKVWKEHLNRLKLREVFNNIERMQHYGTRI